MVRLRQSGAARPFMAEALGPEGATDVVVVGAHGGAGTSTLAGPLTTTSGLRPHHRIVRHLEATWRTNRHKTTLYRDAAARIANTLAQQLPFAALTGLAFESALYEGNGTRQLSDIDLLISSPDAARVEQLLARIGYQPTGNGGMRLPTQDIVLPVIHVDLAKRLPGLPDSPDADALTNQVLSRCNHQPVPGHPAALPVLSGEDSYRAALVRLADEADGEPPLAQHADAARLQALNSEPVCSPWPSIANALAGQGLARLDTLRQPEQAGDQPPCE